MPATVEAPLAVLFTLPGGVTYRRRLDDLPNQRLAAHLAAGLAAATHPHGPIRTRSVAMQYVQTARRMVRELHDAEFGGGLSELSPAVIVEYWLGCDFHRERRIRAILAAYAATGGVLDAGVGRHLQGRRINQIVKSRPNPPYSDTEWRRLTAACTELITSSRRAHRQVLATIEADTKPDEHGASADNLARLLYQNGPATAATILDRLGPTATARVGRVEVLAARRALYPDADTALAYLTLFAMRTGIVPDGIDALTLDDITRTSTSTILVSYTKGRTGREALNLPRDAVRLLDRWLEHSAQLRAHAGDQAENVWLYVPVDDRGTGHGLIYTRPRTQTRRAAFAATTGLLDDDGRPLRLHGGRIRATYQHRRDRSTWTGRTTIDPNHSAQVEGDHYLHSHTTAQLDALETIIEQAQTDLRRKGEPPIIHHRPGCGRVRRELPGTGGTGRARRRRDHRAAERAAGRVRRRLRLTHEQPARPGRHPLPGPAVGVSAVSAGHLRAPASAQPAAAQVLLRPSRHPDDRCAVPRCVRPLRRPTR